MDGMWRRFLGANLGGETTKSNSATAQMRVLEFRLGARHLILSDQGAGGSFSKTKT